MFGLKYNAMMMLFDYLSVFKIENVLTETNKRTETKIEGRVVYILVR